LNLTASGFGDLQDAIASRRQKISPVRVGGSLRLELGAFSTCRSSRMGQPLTRAPRVLIWPVPGRRMPSNFLPIG